MLFIIISNHRDHAIVECLVMIQFKIIVIAYNAHHVQYVVSTTGPLGSILTDRTQDT